MQKVRRLPVGTIVTASALALMAGVGGWAAGSWRASNLQTAETALPPVAGEGAAPESDTRAGMHDVCSRRIGCLVR